MSADAATKEKAQIQLKQMMNQAGIDAHWAEHHQNDTGPKPTVEQAAMMIDTTIYEDAAM